MINNDVIRSIRYMLSISEFKLVEIVKLGGGEVTQSQMNAFIKKEEEPGFEDCPQNVMARFLNGLIYLRRGKDDTRPPLVPDLPTNNVVLKKLRVAFELKDEDIIAMLEESGFKVSKPELSAFFRKFGHQHYRECGDQFLRSFLKGLTKRIKNNP